MKITIEYCSKWNYLPRASSLEQELYRDIGQDTSVELIASSGGIYEVMADDMLIFSKRQLNRFPADGEIVRLLQSW